MHGDVGDVRCGTGQARFLTSKTPGTPVKFLTGPLSSVKTLTGTDLACVRPRTTVCRLRHTSVVSCLDGQVIGRSIRCAHSQVVDNAACITRVHTKTCGFVSPCLTDPANTPVRHVCETRETRRFIREIPVDNLCVSHVSNPILNTI